MRMKRVKIIEEFPIPWSEATIQAFRETLLAWYDQEKRDLPWRQTKDPYKIWVSEIMLQQTQVNTVIPYYERFIEALPNIQALAEAEEETLLNLWQGLGYYSRVRNMQTAAQQVMGEYDGQLPKTAEALRTLKGIGPYTAGAIASIAFGEPEPAVDGNLMRIVTRLFEIGEDIGKASTKRQITAYLYQMIDPERPGDFNQALMDLGATIMTPANLTPELSPLKAFDQSYQHGTAELYPVKKSKVTVTEHNFLAYILMNPNGEVLFRKHGEGELLTGLWHFPLIEQTLVMDEATEQEMLEPLTDWLTGTDLAFSKEQFHLSLPQAYRYDREQLLRHLPLVKHQFSHRLWYVQLVPVQVNQSSNSLSGQLEWLTLEELKTYPMSTLQTKLLQRWLPDLGV